MFADSAERLSQSDVRMLDGKEEAVTGRASAPSRTGIQRPYLQASWSMGEDSGVERRAIDEVCRVCKQTRRPG